MATTVTIDTGWTPLAAVRAACDGPVTVRLPSGWADRVRAGRGVLEDALARDEVIYAVTTGFGKLASRRIGPRDVTELQYRLIRSHQVGVGPLLPDRIVRMVLLLKLISLVQGYSAVRPEVIETLTGMLDHDLLPCVPAQGSVGASGDLAPLAHLTAAALGESRVRVDGRQVDAADALARAGLRPLVLEAKEAIALINGTQVSAALALAALSDAERIFRAAVGAGAMSLEALAGNVQPLDERIHELRRQQGQIDVARAMRTLTAGSPLLTDERPRRTQDMYSLRCQPQVMGAALDLLRFAGDTLDREANAVTDNPLVFAAGSAMDGGAPDGATVSGPAGGAIVSGGNFHAAPVAYAADLIVMALCEVGSICERRQFVLNDESLSGLPAFLTASPGLNSGMTMTQVTSAALVAENRGLAFPRSVDSVPTVASQEDHVSMATGGALRALDVARNAAHIVAIELLMSAQALDLRRPDRPGPNTAPIHAAVRAAVGFLDDDRPLSGAIASLAGLVLAGRFSSLVPIKTIAGL